LVDCLGVVFDVVDVEVDIEVDVDADVEVVVVDINDDVVEFNGGCGVCPAKVAGAYSSAVIKHSGTILPIACPEDLEDETSFISMFKRIERKMDSHQIETIQLFYASRYDFLMSLRP
jgi:hypothetical protein